jgi:hypothetical protein
MSILTSYYSLVEQAKRINPDGTLATIVEVLNREMGMMLQEAPWLPSNDTWVNKTVRRGTLPSSSRRKLNQGVATSSGRTTEVLDVIEMREVYAEYDKDYIDAFPEPGRARLQEAAAFLEGLGQDLTSDVLYCDSYADPDGMHGIEPRLDTVDGEFVIDGSGTGSDVTSIYVVTWGATTCHLIYPKNMANLGIKHTDLGEVTISDATTAASSTSQFQGYRDHFQVKCGLVVRHPKCIGRVANIETSGTTNTFDEDDLITLLNNMKVDAGTRIYCNQTIKTQAEIRLKDKNNVYWTSQNGLDGVPFMAFRGIPVRMIDKNILLNTETAIS